MPRRSDDSVRVGLNSTVRARISEKLGKLSGPLTNAVMADAFSRFTPGVMSTSTTERTRSGWASVSAIVVAPPSDMPITAFAFGASTSTARATSSALSCRPSEPFRPPSE